MIHCHDKCCNNNNVKCCNDIVRTNNDIARFFFICGLLFRLFLTLNSPAGSGTTIYSVCMMWNGECCVSACQFFVPLLSMQKFDLFKSTCPFFLSLFVYALSSSSPSCCANFHHLFCIKRTDIVTENTQNDEFSFGKQRIWAESEKKTLTKHTLMQFQRIKGISHDRTRTHRLIYEVGRNNLWSLFNEIDNRRNIRICLALLCRKWLRVCWCIHSGSLNLHL